MAAETLIFMPNGDVTLTLIRNVFKEEDSQAGTSALQQTAIDEKRNEAAADQVEENAHLEPKEKEEPEDSEVFFAPDPPESEYFEPPPPRRRDSDASSRRDRSASPPAAFWASLKRRQVARTSDLIEDEYSATPPNPARKPERTIVSSHEVHCVVSSRHMMLASKYFEKMLSATSNDTATLRSKGTVSIRLSGDLDAMIILLNIVHGVSRKVPRQVDLEVLSKLAVLVSIFGMLDAVQFFSDTWIDNFQRTGLPESYNENVLPLLFIFWVFDRPSEFKNMTRLAQRECDEKVEDDAREVPIPHSIIDAIKRDREFAMESAVTVIHTLINRYLEGRTICDGAFDEDLGYACDAMVLGSLLKSSRKIGIWPKPEAPFNGRKFKDLARAIRSIKILDVCKKTSSRRLHMLGPSSNCHGLEDSIEASMKSIEAGMGGLELSDYPKESDDQSFEIQLVPTASSNEELTGRVQEGGGEDFPISMKEGLEMQKKELKAPEREAFVPQATLLTPHDSKNLKEHPQKEVQRSPRQDSTTYLQQPHVSGRLDQREAVERTTEEKKESERSTRSEESKFSPTAIGKVGGDIPKGKVSVLTEKATASFPAIPKDVVNTPMKEICPVPRVVSSEEKLKEVPVFEKELVKPSNVEVKATLSDAPTTTEDEDTVVLPFSKMRKSKKRFSAKY